jgi:site-specific DNA recombinase
MPPDRGLRAVPETAARAVLYLRQSTYREESISLELQEQANRDYCDRHGYTVTEVIRDAGISGLKWEKRPGIQQVMQQLRDGHADVVIVYRWSRLSRHRLHQALALDAIEQAGARVESATEPFDTETAAGGFGRDVLLAAAHYESQLRSEQWKEAHERRRAAGVPITGGVRFGYVISDGAYQPDPVTGPLLAAMYADYIRGVPAGAIARRLNDAGHLVARTGTRWTSAHTLAVMDSGFGAGQLSTGTRRAITYSPGVHPPVIDQQTWAAYQEAREARRGKPSKSTPAYTLSGLMRCGDCGGGMHSTALGRERGYGFICSAWSKTRAGRCVTVSRAKAERVVLDWLASIVSEVEERSVVEATRTAAQLVARTDAADLRRQVLRLDERLTKLTLGWTDGTVPDAAYTSARTELADRRAELVARARDAETDERDLDGPAVAVVRDLLDRWDEMPVAGRQALLQTLIRAVVVHRPERRGQVVTLTVHPRWTS